MIQELLSEMEQEFGFTVQPINRIYGMFFPTYAAHFKNRLIYEGSLNIPEHSIFPKIFVFDPETQKFLESEAYFEGYEVDNNVVKFLNALNWIEVRTPEDLFIFVDTFYSTTLLYYRVTPFIHWSEYDPWTEYPVGMEAGFNRLAELESSIPKIFTDFSTPIDIDFIIKWNKRTKRQIKKPLTLMWRTFYRNKEKLKTRVWYSVKLSEFFRDELLARLEFYKKLRNELATVLEKDIRDFSKLHHLFVQYYGSIKFIDLFKFARHKAGYFLFENESEERLSQLRRKTRLAARRENKEEYQQEYFFAVREHHKEVIKCVIRMADCEKYSIEQRNLMLRYFLFNYMRDISTMEDIWNQCQSQISAGMRKYTEFFSKMNELDLNNNESLKKFLEKLCTFITLHPRFGVPLSKDELDITMKGK